MDNDIDSQEFDLFKGYENDGFVEDPFHDKDGGIIANMDLLKGMDPTWWQPRGLKGTIRIRRTWRMKIWPTTKLPKFHPLRRSHGRQQTLQRFRQRHQQGSRKLSRICCENGLKHTALIRSHHFYKVWLAKLESTLLPMIRPTAHLGQLAEANGRNPFLWVRSQPPVIN